jgi:DNA-binding response OmpR family regulator
MMAKILVADDEMDVGLIVTERLRRSGHEVEYVSDGNQAMQKIEKNAYNLVILDVHMPGHSGYEVCEYSKRSEKNAATPVLIMSAFPEEQSVWNRRHANAFLAKPFETGQLAAEVDRLLKGIA